VRKVADAQVEKIGNGVLDLCALEDDAAPDHVVSTRWTVGVEDVSVGAGELPAGVDGLRAVRVGGEPRFDQRAPAGGGLRVEIQIDVAEDERQLALDQRGEERVFRRE
jgi:hypothetical protein